MINGKSLTSTNLGKNYKPYITITITITIQYIYIY